MARAIWKGVLRLGDDDVPVKLYAAVEDRSVDFRLLVEDEEAPVERRMVNPVTDETVPYAEARRGREVDDGRVVVLDDEDLEAIEPDDSRDIEVLRFVEPGVLPHLRYDRPYYLGPDGDPESWSALARALEATGREGVVRWVMRNREHHGALLLHRGRPVLVTLRSTEEVVDTADLEAPEGRELEEDELEMARTLVGAMEGSFDPGAWEDSYRGRVRELLEAKAEGKTVSLREYRERKEEGEMSLREALEASLEEAEGA